MATTASNNNDSAFRALYAILTQALTRTGIYVGTTAGYPRVEIHSITEGERIDKGGDLRKLSCTVESMTDTTLLSCHTMNQDNLTRILALAGQTLRGYRIDGIVVSQLQEITEVADTKSILFRLLQGMDFFMTHTGPEDPEPEPEEGTENEAETKPEEENVTTE